jgi:hypothetical protein
LVEQLSSNLSRYYVDKFGAVLHHSLISGWSAATPGLFEHGRIRLPYRPEDATTDGFGR